MMMMMMMMMIIIIIIIIIITARSCERVLVVSTDEQYHTAYIKSI